MFTKWKQKKEILVLRLTVNLNLRGCSLRGRLIPFWGHSAKKSSAPWTPQLFCCPTSEKGTWWEEMQESRWFPYHFLSHIILFDRCVCWFTWSFAFSLGAREDPSLVIIAARTRTKNIVGHPGHLKELYQWAPMLHRTVFIFFSFDAEGLSIFCITYSITFFFTMISIFTSLWRSFATHWNILSCYFNSESLENNTSGYFITRILAFRAAFPPRVKSGGIWKV